MTRFLLGPAARRAPLVDISLAEPDRQFGGYPAAVGHLDALALGPLADGRRAGTAGARRAGRPAGAGAGAAGAGDERAHRFPEFLRMRGAQVNLVTRPVHPEADGGVRGAASVKIVDELDFHTLSHTSCSVPARKKIGRQPRRSPRPAVITTPGIALSRAYCAPLPPGIRCAPIAITGVYQMTGGGIESALAASPVSHPHTSQAWRNAEWANSSAVACGSALAMTSSQSRMNSPSPPSQRAA